MLWKQAPCTVQDSFPSVACKDYRKRFLKVQLYVAVCPVGFVVITNLRISQLNQHTCPLVQDASEG